jgi:hypothetical protein
MNNKIVIEPCEGGFKGFLYNGETLVYETPIYSDPSLASKDLMRNMQDNNQSSIKTETRSQASSSVTSNVIIPPLRAVENAPQPPRPKKCCGRS